MGTQLRTILWFKRHTNKSCAFIKFLTKLAVAFAAIDMSCISIPYALRSAVVLIDMPTSRTSKQVLDHAITARVQCCLIFFGLISVQALNVQT